jgi:cytochrome P450
LIVDETCIFLDKLAERAAEKKVFRLEELVTRLTVDVIGKLALDVNLGTQTGENPMVNALREQVQLLPGDSKADPLKMWRPYGIYRRWKNARIMEKYIGDILDKRFAEQKKDMNGTPTGKEQRKRTIIDLAMQAYNDQQGKDKSSQSAVTMDEDFRASAIVQVRTFIFAGHDTTSSTVAYAFYELQRSPEALAALRSEHERVLGPVEGAADAIKEDPYIVNKLEYTTAVIKETLRLWPAASSTRSELPGYTLRDSETGEALPVDDGTLVWVIHWPQHRNRRVWGDDADVFKPSRFLPENAATLPEGMYRPFEKGPRNCIGQEFAMLEARM